MENGFQTTPHLPVSVPYLYVEYPIKMKEKNVSRAVYSELKSEEGGLISHVSLTYPLSHSAPSKKENITNSMAKVGERCWRKDYICVADWMLAQVNFI